MSTTSDSGTASRARAATRASPSEPRLKLYRMLGSFELLHTYRAKFVAVVLAAILVPAFLLMFVIVLGAGRLSGLALIMLVALLAATSAGFLIWAIGRLLEPLELAGRAIDDLSLQRPLSRADLPGSDVAARILRGVHALVSRNESQALEARERGERDELTGLYTRRAARERGQVLVDQACRRGLVVRALVADIDGFTAFNARHGSGHGDALLKAIGARLVRLAGEQGVAARWHGDTFLLLQAGSTDDLGDADELMGRPIVVKGNDEPLQLQLGVAVTELRVPIDKLVSDAEAALSSGRARDAAR
jgi:diguanylate cyclase (GGDEF)-like protein